ncbi:methyltransferase domain-containing protein [Intrasporangium calvum]|uniref:Methyltransferase domain-containing protein n=1 Tax=Intrasporangium calvum TaxID=53358 RepID=A0ABT5GL45_9MICO|nr:class I SAM-dependent methyltransferase [Intrasporangium calvum]MDC5698897.1 methyltransferase domain-containing protein [Intrasporangium calvum]
MPRAEETLTKKAYDTVADVYADRFTATEPEQPVELAMIDHFAGLLHEPRRVLDAGCGAGRMLPYLAAQGCRPEGVDLSPEMVRRAQSDHPDYPCTVRSLTDLDYPDATFDGVFSWYSTIHNPDDDLDSMFAEMVRVLRPGGHLLVAFQVGDGMRRVGQGFAALGYDIVMNRYHRATPDMVARLEAHGLEVTAQLERSPVPSESDPQAVVIARRPQNG